MKTRISLIMSHSPTTLNHPYFWATVCKRVRLCYRTVVMSCPVRPVCPVCLWRWCTVAKRFDGSRWKLGQVGVQVGLGPGHNVLDGDTAQPPLKGHSPQFSAHICCGQMAGWIKMPLCTEVGFGPGDFVLDEDPAPLPKKGAEPPPPQFLAHVNCGQFAFSALTLLAGRQEGHPACKNMWIGVGGHWLVRMEWRPAWWSVCLPLLIFPCTIKSRSSLLALAHPGCPGKGKRP